MTVFQTEVFHRWMSLLAILNGIDFFTTKAIVDKLGFEAEANWFMWKLITSTGTIYSILIAKTIFIVGVWFMIMHRQHSGTILIIKWLCAIYGLLAVWNFGGVVALYF